MIYNIILILSVILICLFLWCRYWRHIGLLMQRCWIYLGKRCSQPALLRCMGQFQHHGCCAKVWRVVSIFICARVDSGLSLKHYHAYVLAIKYISFIRRICYTCVIITHIKIKNKKPRTAFCVAHQQIWHSYVAVYWKLCFHMLVSNLTTSELGEILLNYRFLFHP